MESGTLGALEGFVGGRGGEGVRSAEEVPKSMKSSKSEEGMEDWEASKRLSAGRLLLCPAFRSGVDCTLGDEASSAADEKSAISELEGSGDRGLAIIGEAKDDGGGCRSGVGARAEVVLPDKGGGGMPNRDCWGMTEMGVGSDDWKSAKSSSSLSKSNFGVADLPDNEGGGASKGACVAEFRGAFTMMGVCARDGCGEMLRDGGLRVMLTLRGIEAGSFCAAPG